MMRFDLWSLLQGQMRKINTESAYNSLILVPRGLQCDTNILVLMC